MGWFMTNAWEAFGGEGIFAIATVYALGFAVGGWKLWTHPRQPALRTPGGLLVTLAVGMMPLAIYGLERWFNWWPQEDPGAYANFHPYVNGSWIVMELGTVLAGVVALRFVRFPFLTAPVAFALWFLSMDLTPILFHRQEFSWDERKWVSLWFGLGMLVVALAVDVARRWRGPDYSFWLSLFGLLAFWGGLTSMDSSDERGKLIYALINVGLMGIGVVVNRRACVVFGAIGVNIYLGHLAYDAFRQFVALSVRAEPHGTARDRGRHLLPTPERAMARDDSRLPADRLARLPARQPLIRRHEMGPGIILGLWACNL